MSTFACRNSDRKESEQFTTEEFGSRRCGDDHLVARECVGGRRDYNLRMEVNDYS